MILGKWMRLRFAIDWYKTYLNTENSRIRCAKFQEAREPESKGWMKQWKVEKVLDLYNERG